jgi:phosphopantetheinyl transferase
VATCAAEREPWFVIPWQPSTDAPSWEDGAVHVWRVSLLRTDQALQSAAQILSADELARAQRFLFERDRSRFIACRSTLRVLLAKYLRGSAPALQFQYNPFGKPELAAGPLRVGSETQPTRPFGKPELAAGPLRVGSETQPTRPFGKPELPAGPLRVGSETQPTSPFGKPELAAVPLQFNVSHSGDWALIAVTQAPRVGVDLECLRPLDDVDALARTSLSARELAVYHDLPRVERHQAFFNAWTRKEAVIKGSGTGLSRPLADCEVTFAPGQPIQLLQVDGDRDAAAGWSLFALEPLPGYLGAVAVERPDARLARWEWPDATGSDAGE